MLTKIFPFLSWLKGYNTNSFRQDFIAGLTVALVLIPQSMAYAQLAGMPSYYGLYAAFLPPMIAALFGSSRQLATGPVAVVSLMTAASLAPLATAGSEGYIAYAILLSLIVGTSSSCLGVLRLGLVVNFLSHPVVNGFTNAGAIIIATSQLEKMFGVYVDGKAHHYETIIEVCKSAVHYTHWPTFVIGVSAFDPDVRPEKDGPESAQCPGGGGPDHRHFLGHRLPARHQGGHRRHPVRQDPGTDCRLQHGHEGQTGSGEKADRNQQDPR